MRSERYYRNICCEICEDLERIGNGNDVSGSTQNHPGRTAKKGTRSAIPPMGKEYSLQDN